MLNYWNDVNKKVVNEFFEVLYLEKNIMSVDTFNEFRLLIHLICVNCHQEENFHFLVKGGDLFNREGDLILSYVDLFSPNL